METTASTSNTDTWQPAWERDPKFKDLLKPYSTATVVYDGGRSQPELWDICNGCILWLPPKAVVGEISDPKLANEHPNFFDHPALILNIEISGPRSGTVQFARMTSLSGRPFSEIHPTRWDDYLPISPTESHPNSGIQLHLENKAPKRAMIAPCYVSIGQGVFNLDFKALLCYAASQKADGYRHRLTEESFNQVMGKLGRSPSAWIETGQLWETFLQNHVPSAGTMDI